VPGIDVGDSEDGAVWIAFLRSLQARGLAGVQLVVSYAHTGLKAAIGSVPLGTVRQRCRVHYADLGIMPTWRREVLVATARAAEGRHNLARLIDQSTLFPPDS
jgi:transposase-like protein